MAEAPKSPRRPTGPGRTRVIMIIAALVLVALFVAWRHRGSTSAATSQRTTTQAIPVETATVQRADVPVYLQGLGSVQAFYTVKITPRVDGQLQQVDFTEGQEVDKGEVLAQIDPRPYQAALEQAIGTHDKDLAQLDNAKADLKRYQQLAPQNLTSRQTLDTQKAMVAQIRAQLKSDRAAIANARTQLGYATIKSPIRGRTGIRMVDPGNIVHATDTTPIVVVTQVQPISVIFTLPEEQLAAVNSAMAKGPVDVIALPRDTKTGGNAVLDRGHIDLIDNQIDPTTGTIRLKATFPNPHKTLWPGEFVTARTLLKTEHDVLTIPAAAVQRGPDGTFAYVVQPDNTVAVQPINVDEESGESVVVRKGLKAGTQIVTSNQFRLEPGTHIELITDAPASAASATSVSGPVDPARKQHRFVQEPQ